MKHLVLLPLLFVCLLSKPCFSQDTKAPLTNDNVISLWKAGLSKPLILTTIANSNTLFDVSTNAIIALKTNGVPDDVIAAIITKQNATPGTAVSTRKDSTANTLGAGIYYEDPTSGAKTQLEENVFSQSKSGNLFLTAVTYGIAKAKAKAVLSGTQANFQVTNSNPVFYFIFPSNSTGSSIGDENGQGFFSHSTNPNEFILIRFKVVKKGREVVTGTFGTYSGFTSGIDDDNKVSYRYSKVSPGVYKVFFESPLHQGEYAFIFAGGTTGTSYTMGGSTSTQKAFDFSITK